MKFTTLSLLALGASAVSARFVEKHEIDQVAINGYQDAEELYTVELAPGEVKKVTEDEKWELRRVCLSILALNWQCSSWYWSPFVLEVRADLDIARHQLHGHLRERRPRHHDEHPKAQRPKIPIKCHSA